MRGGAVSIVTRNRATEILVQNCFFRDNSLTQTIGLHGVSAEGGALHVQVNSDSSNLSIEGSHFENNLAQAGSTKTYDRFCFGFPHSSAANRFGQRVP
jgi:hypothetical protein